MIIFNLFLKKYVIINIIFPTIIIIMQMNFYSYQNKQLKCIE